MDEAAAPLARLRATNRDEQEEAARALRILAKARPKALESHGAELLKRARAAKDLRVRWNLIVALGKPRYPSAQRAAAIDWLWERLRDASPLTRTLALQALFDLSGGDDALRGRLVPVANDFLQNGTAAMRARARKLLKANADSLRE